MATNMSTVNRTVRWIITLLAGFVVLWLFTPIAGAYLSSPYWEIVSLAVPAAVIYALIPPESRGI